MICGPARTTPMDTRDLYAKALTEYHSYTGDPIATIDEALKQSPEFILGHIFRAALFLTMTEKRFLGEARSSLNAATALLPYATSRERLLTTAVTKFADGKWDDASAAFDRVLVDNPRDAFAIQTAHLMDFFRGDSLNLRNRISRVLPAWNRDVPGYSYILGMHAFGLEESNQYDVAEETGRRALELQPKDAWAVHAVTHVMEMQGRIDDGIRWLESRTNDWAPNNSFAYHNWWHLALFYLDRAMCEKVLGIYDKQIHPEPAQFVLQMVDATALLWRLGLEGVDIGDRASVLADNWAGRLEAEKGFYAFNDFHAMMAFVLAGREKEADRLIADMEATAGSSSEGTNVMMTRDVGLPLARAIRAFGRGEYESAATWIQDVRDIANRFGGSHAQRDVLTLTLIEAAIRSGQSRLAQHYIAERTVLRPGGQWGPRLLRRAT